MARRTTRSQPGKEPPDASTFKPRTIDTELFTPFRVARGHAIAIARDRTELLTADAKTAALKYIDSTLELWKRAQADESGMIEIQPVVGLLGAFYGSASGMTLADLANPGPKRFLADHLKPWNCAGPFVHSAADLWVKLWADKYEAVTVVENNLPLDLAMALLVERDGLTMPVDSMASALHYVWISTWVSLKIYRDETRALAAIVGKRNELRRKQLDDLKVAREINAKNRAERALKVSNDLMTMAIDLFVVDISQTNDRVASASASTRNSPISVTVESVTV